MDFQLAGQMFMGDYITCKTASVRVCSIVTVHPPHQAVEVCHVSQARVGDTLISSASKVSQDPVLSFQVHIALALNEL